MDGLREQLSRTPAPAPRLVLARHADGRAKEPDDLAFDDVTLEGYDPQPAIRFPVAV